MFHGQPWFAWYPVTVRTRTGTRLAWLETVWRDQMTNRDGSTTCRYYQN